MVLAYEVIGEQRGTCIKGVTWSLWSQKLKIAFHKFLLLAYEKNNSSVKFRHLFKFNRCYGNKYVRQNMLKTEILRFLTNLRDDHLRIRFQHSTKILLTCCVP